MLECISAGSGIVQVWGYLLFHYIHLIFLFDFILQWRFVAFNRLLKKNDNNCQEKGKNSKHSHTQTDTAGAVSNIRAFSNANGYRQ